MEVEMSEPPSGGGIDAVGEFAVKMEKLLDEDTYDALSMLQEDANEKLVQTACMELIPMIGERMKKLTKVDANGEAMIEDQGQWDIMEEMLKYLTETCKPKEVLLALLDLVERVSSDHMFALLLRLLQKIFIRLPDRRGTEFVWVLRSIIDFLQKLPLPPPHQLDDHEMVALENCNVSRRLEQCVMTALNFCEAFVSEAKECRRAPNDKVRGARLLQLACFFLKLLERPIADLEVGDSDKMGYTAPFSLCCNRVVDLLIDLVPDVILLHSLLNSGGLSIDCDWMEESTMSADLASLGVLEYLLRLGGGGRHRQPTVYSHQFLFDTCLPSCVALCRRSADRASVALARKSVALFESMLQNIYEREWPRDRLSIRSYQDIAFGMLTIMQHCPLLSLRQRALRCFERFIRSFDDLGQMAFVRMMFHQLDRPGSPERDNTNASNYLGWLIDFYRKRLSESWSTDLIRETPSMLSMFCYLPNAEESDLLERRDIYLAALNFARFVALTNNRLNLSSNLYKGLNDSFVRPFGKGLEISVAHYNLEIRNGEKEEEAARAESRKLDDMFYGKMEMCQKSLLTLNMMQSLLSHVSEVVNANLT